MRAQVDEIARRYLSAARPTGESGLRATCPLCKHTRTFLISYQDGGWVCFACHSSGGLLQLLLRLGLPRKLVDQIRKELSLQPVVPWKLRRIAGVKRTAETGILPEYILSAFEEMPPQMLELGFTEETLRQYDIGYDRVRNRITFPIRDLYGRLVAISGRACSKTDPVRYLVYRAEKPEHELWGVVEKGYVPLNREHLYGYNEVFPRKFFSVDAANSPLIVVEGFKGCLWLRQLGFPNTVALMGSSLTDSQRNLLGKLKGPYYIMLDHEPGKAFPDPEGRCAAVDVAQRLRMSGRTYLCLYPGWTDENPYGSKPKGTSPDDLSLEEVTLMLKGARSHAQLVAARPSDTWKRG